MRSNAILDKLYNFLLTTSEIICMNCSSTNSVHCIDGYDAAEHFMNNGWRATKHNVYCPKCGRTKLKPKK